MEPTEKDLKSLNAIHKRLVVLYGDQFSKMKHIWSHVRREYYKENGARLPLSLRKNPGKFILLFEWVETKIAEEGKEEIYFLNKQDMVERGWNDKLIMKLYPKPDYKMYLGRGRFAYYYNGTTVSELEDKEEFIEFITKKLSKKKTKPRKKDGFGSEFIFNLE